MIKFAKFLFINLIKLYWPRGVRRKGAKRRKKTEKKFCVFCDDANVGYINALQSDTVLIKWYIDVLNVSVAMIKMCGNKEVVCDSKQNWAVRLVRIPADFRRRRFAQFSYGLFPFSVSLPVRMRRARISFCLSNDNENKWQIMPSNITPLLSLSLTQCLSLVKPRISGEIFGGNFFCFSLASIRLRKYFHLLCYVIVTAKGRNIYVPSPPASRVVA